MTKMRTRKSWVALLAILLLFAACKGETPTAPPPGGDTPGGTTPPQNATLTLVASKTTPLVNETVTLTATVTLNGQPVPNGTAVEFVSSNPAATFTDTGTTTTIRTTTSGVSTALLTSAANGTTRVTATVNNVSRFVDITFSTIVTPPCIPPDPACTSTDPTITAVNPSTGRPTGGEQIKITGTNFREPVRVLFDLGNGQVKEGFVVSVTSSEIVVITPAVDLGAGQQQTAQIVVLTEAGAATSDRIVAPTPFTFRNVVLTPLIYTVTPNSSTIDGGKLITIVGEGFQAPVQVFFSASPSGGVTMAEARVIESNFSQIIVEAPPAHLVTPAGSGPFTGLVDVIVINIGSNTRDIEVAGFRYISKMLITGVSPLTASALGGTDITIDGVGFDSKVQVFIAGVEARVLRVTGTQLLVRAGPLPFACAGAAGNIIVQNTDSGDSDIYGNAPNELGPAPFVYFPVLPLVTSIIGLDVDPTRIIPGETVRVTVANPGTGPLGTGNIRFLLIGRTIIPTPSTTTEPIGPTVFEFPLPLTGFAFPTEACTTDIGAFPGTRLVSVDVPLTFQNQSSVCSTIQTLTVSPSSNTCVRLPAIAAQTTPAPGTCANAGAVAITDPATGQATITFRNNAVAGATELVVTPSTPTGTNGTEFSISPANETIPGQQTRSFTVTFNPAAAGTRTGAVVFTTNDPNNGTFTICLQGTGTP